MERGRGSKMFVLLIFNIFAYAEGEREIHASHYRNTKSREPEPSHLAQNCDVRGSRRRKSAESFPASEPRKVSGESRKLALSRERTFHALKALGRASRTKINSSAFRVLYLLLHARYTQSSASRCKDLLPHFMVLTDDAHEDC
jgi:hypothetical protein